MSGLPAVVAAVTTVATRLGVLDANVCTEPALAIVLLHSIVGVLLLLELDKAKAALGVSADDSADFIELIVQLALADIIRQVSDVNSGHCSVVTFRKKKHYLKN